MHVGAVLLRRHYGMVAVTGLNWGYNLLRSQKHAGSQKGCYVVFGGAEHRHLTG